MSAIMKSKERGRKLDRRARRIVDNMPGLRWLFETPGGLKEEKKEKRRKNFIKSHLFVMCTRV